MKTIAPTDSGDEDLLEQILSRLGISQPIPTDLAGLHRVYVAWCRSVPFDNVRKMTSLLSNSSDPLPGTSAGDFFEYWLRYGCGGTCWATSNALFELVDALGFDARRVAGSMRDVGVANHGSVKVRIDGRDWLIDSSMLTNVPLPLGDGFFAVDDPIVGVEIEHVDDTHVLWFDVPPNDDFFPCRILVDPVDHLFYVEHYERSRLRSPFNTHLYVRKNLSDGMVVLRGPTRYHKTERGVERHEQTPDALLRGLRDEIGISEQLLKAWVASGGLDATYQPWSGSPPPLTDSSRPSLRTRI